MSKVVIIHTSTTDAGGIVNATIFYAASLIASGIDAEIWTPSKGLKAKASALSVPVFYHEWLQNAGLAIIHPKIIARALALRGTTSHAIHQGEKLWLFGQIWLRGIGESVVFHNRKINQRRYFKRWLAVSEQHRVDLEAYAKSRNLKKIIRKIHNGPLLHASRLSPRKRLAIKTIGCMGNFGDKKAVHILIRAFAELIGKGHDLRLTLGGDGPERWACEALANELGIASRISWLGWLNDPAPFYDEIDLFCLPSIDEPFGIVVTEAMQAGLPVVATSTYGPREIVIPGKTGWLVPPNDVVTLANALEAAVTDPQRAADYGMAGYRRFESTYSLPAAGQQLIEAFDL